MAQQSTSNQTEIVRLVSDIYKTLIWIGHFEEDEVIWAPAERHSLDLSRFDDSSRIDMGVISLMRHLPALKTEALHKNLRHRMPPVNYLDPLDLVIRRDSDKLEYRRPPGQSLLNMGNALPTELQLLQGEQSDDPCLVLDIADSEGGLPILHR